MKKYPSFILLVLSNFLVLPLCAQKPSEIPRNLFAPPMAHKAVLAGSFGELRDGHFHAGDDLKTQFVVGKEIHAPAEGSVVRVSIGRGGYGKALYIRHPNGYTTVYGHLNGYAPKIDSLVRAEQYARKSYTINREFPENEVLVKKGELVAYSGNTGSSMGPHLHFEVRRTEDNKVMNPMLFGLRVADRRAPTIQGIYLMNTEGSDSLETLSEPRRIAFGKNSDRARITARGQIAFLVDAYDTMDDAPNKNGVYGIDLYVNGRKAYGMRLDGFYFEDSGMIERHIAYDYYAMNGTRLVKCFVEPFNTLTIYDDSCKASPILNVEKGSQYEVRIDVSDIAGNVSRKYITVMGSESAPAYIPKPTAEPSEHSHLLYFDAGKYNKIKYGRFEADFPAGTFYKNLQFDFEALDSMTFRLHRRTVPLKNSFTVSFDISHLPPEVQQKTVIAVPYPRGGGSIGYSFLGGKAENGRISLRTSSLTTFTIAQDTVPPQIDRGSWREGEKLRGRYLRMYIRDGQTGISSFNAYVDGKWVVMEYEYKRRELSLDVVREKITPGKHTFRLEVTDGVGNKSVFEGIFLL